MNEWQTIETAPKDGRMIRVKWEFPGGNYPTGVVQWDNDIGQWKENQGGFLVEVIEPTHWMPLGS